MKTPVVLGYCLLHAALAPAIAEQPMQPVSQSEAAAVNIEPVPAGRRLIRLPEVRFPLRIAPACATDFAFESLSISIADTRMTFRAADFESDTAIETILRVPGRQIGPLAVDGFCIAAADSSSTTINVPDAFTANVSVRCSSETQQSVSYDTFGLEILLICSPPDEPAEFDSAAPAAADRATDKNQESSSTTRF